uniref:Uncharacterized protein n=1 Tax=Anguilla anguilla TaxID=7936 RepID=A0A0E9PHG0_ANGAN
MKNKDSHIAHTHTNRVSYSALVPSNLV